LLLLVNLLPALLLLSHSFCEPLGFIEY